MISVLSFIPDPRLTTAYPEAAALRDAVRARNWSGVVAGYHQVDNEGRSLLARAAGDMRGVEVLLRSVLDGDPSDPVAPVLLASHLIEKGWRVRTHARARYVSNQRFAAFHRYLDQAEQVLAEHTARHPDDVAAWVLRLSTARGLELGQPEARRRFDAVTRLDPYHVLAQERFLQQLAPKWGGSFEAMHAFARQCADVALPGALNATMVPMGHLERWMDLGGGWSGRRYLRRAEVREEIHDAAARSVLHTNHRPTFGWIWARNVFAMTFSAMGDPTAAAPHFAVVGNHLSRVPWMYFGQPELHFTRHRVNAAVRRTLRRG